MRAFAALLLLFAAAIGQAAEIGKVCDRHGILLMEVERGADSQITKRYPLKAFAAHLLHDLSVLPEPGETIFLTIDSRVQMAAEKALRAVSRGCAVIIAPQTGDVLAIASVPSFDPGAFDRAALQADETDPFRSRATSAYAPGAAFLPVTALAGLSKGLRDFSYSCSGYFPIGNKMMKCWLADKGRNGHGEQTLPLGLKNSCGPFFFAYGIAAGPEAIFSTAETFGFGERSGLPIREEETGKVSLKRYLAEVSLHEAWTDGYTANTAIGQGMVLVTPLQLASFVANLVDGGDLKKLRLIDRIQRADGSVSRQRTIIRTTLKSASLQPSDLEIVRDAMRASVGPGGNAQKGAIPGFSVGGRTGTAQFWRNGKKDNITYFVGFAESEKELYAFSVMVEGAKSGGGVAAPLAGRIVSSALEEKAAPLEAAIGSFSLIWELPPEEAPSEKNP